MLNRFITKIFRRVIIGPRCFKATNDKWEVTNSKGDKFIVSFGLLFEKRDEIVVRALIIGKWQISFAISPLTK